MYAKEKVASVEAQRD